jgi:hypothetical protein
MDKLEEQLHTKQFREFKGIFTQNSRNAIPQDNFYDLLNVMPIGAANAHSVPDISPLLVDYGSDPIYWQQYANINTTDYIILFASSGRVFAYNIATNNSTQINTGVGQLLGGTNSRLDQYNTDVITIVDLKGYFTWNGTTFVGPISGGIIPAPPYASCDVAVYANSTWLCINRILYISSLPGVGGGTGYDTNSWQLANGALIQRIVDPSLRGQVTRLLSANSYLYVFGKTSITVISGVYIQPGASPPAPSFTMTTLQSLVGTDQPASVVPFDRSILFANKYGIWAITGSSVERISKDIDGTFQYLSFASPICGGQCEVLNIQQASFLLNQANDPVFGNRNIVASFFDGKWWLANYSLTGTITFMCWGVYNDNPTLFGIINNQLYRLFDNVLSSPASSWKTALWPMEDPLANKEIQRAGFEVEVSGGTANFTASIDTTNGSYPYSVQSSVGILQFVNNLGQPLNFVNNLNLPIIFFNSIFQLFVGDSVGGYANYVGMSVTASQGAVYELSGMYMDYYLRNRWS